MGRPKDQHYWNQVTKENNGVLKCKHCGHKFKGGVSRIKAHVDRIQRQGIAVCSNNNFASCSIDPQEAANGMNPVEGKFTLPLCECLYILPILLDEVEFCNSITSCV